MLVFKDTIAVLPVLDTIDRIFIEPVKPKPCPFRMRERECLSQVNKIFTFVISGSGVARNHCCMEWDSEVVEYLVNMRRVSKCNP